MGNVPHCKHEHYKVNIMTKVKFQGTDVDLMGKMPKAGDKAPEFELTNSALEQFTLESLKGKQVILNIFPSIETPVCAESVKQFDSLMEEANDVVVICVSADLPFAFTRFAELNNINNVVSGSTFRGFGFLEDYGVEIAEGALSGLAARAIVVIDEKGIVKHSELVQDITFFPNFEAAIKAL